MNLAIFVTAKTLPDMNALAQELLDRQKLPLVGRLLVFKPSTLPKEKVEPLFKAFSRFLEAREMISVRVHASGATDTQVATMMAMFLLQRYHTAAGPWLVIDAPCAIRLDNPLTAMEHAHRIGKALATGRCTKEYGGRMPIGPVVMSMMAREVRPLVQTSGENWRMRGRHSFGRLPWVQMGPEEYPFSIIGAQGSDALQPLDNKIVSAVRSEITTLPEELAGQPGGPGVEAAEPVVVPEPEPVPILELTQHLVTELPGEGPQLEGEPPEYDYDALSDEQLDNLYLLRTGKAPDKRLGRATKLARCKQKDIRP